METAQQPPLPRKRKRPTSSEKKEEWYSKVLQKKGLKEQGAHHLAIDNTFVLHTHLSRQNASVDQDAYFASVAAKSQELYTIITTYLQGVEEENPNALVVMNEILSYVGDITDGRANSEKWHRKERYRSAIRKQGSTLYEYEPCVLSDLDRLGQLPLQNGGYEAPIYIPRFQKTDSTRPESMVLSHPKDAQCALLGMNFPETRLALETVIARAAAYEGLLRAYEDLLRQQSQPLQPLPQPDIVQEAPPPSSQTDIVQEAMSAHVPDLVLTPPPPPPVTVCSSWNDVPCDEYKTCVNQE